MSVDSVVKYIACGMENEMRSKLKHYLMKQAEEEVNNIVYDICEKLRILVESRLNLESRDVFIYVNIEKERNDPDV
jgi:hypothetical protein